MNRNARIPLLLVLLLAAACTGERESARPASAAAVIRDYYAAIAARDYARVRLLG
jgi:hypothetical protein